MKILGNNNNNIYIGIAVLLIALLYIIKTFAWDSAMYRIVKYNTNNKFYIGTELIKYHTQANGYEVSEGTRLTNNFNDVYDNVVSEVSAKGYGQYNFNYKTNLYSFLEYCHDKKPSETEFCALINTIEVNGVPIEIDNTNSNYCDYSKLIGYRGQTLAGTKKFFFDLFWGKMNVLLGDTFKELQDSYFFEKYTLKASQKLGNTIGVLRAGSGFSGESYNENSDSVWEYLTSLTTYMFSKKPDAVPDSMSLVLKDLVPFLYMAEYDDSISLKEVAQYAYVPLIEGWLKCNTRYHRWEEEYDELFEEGYNSSEVNGYSIEELKKLYDESYQRHKNERGSNGNALLGSDISVIVDSDYNIETKLEATKDYLTRSLEELGLNNDLKEITTRNELMAHYMMENEHIDDTIKDYTSGVHFMTENLQRGTHEPKNSHTALLSDFQVIEFDHLLSEDGHSDSDGLSDKSELGWNGTKYIEKWIDITEFAKKVWDYNETTYKEPTFNQQCLKLVENNPYDVRWDGNKLEYRTLDYKSNPKLDDTDFDGIRDDNERSGYALTGSIIGVSDGIGRIDYTNDFRNFFVNNEKYNDELARMSIVACDLAEGNNMSASQINGNINSYLSTLGFTNIQSSNIEYPISGSYKVKGKVYVGKKTIQYLGYDDDSDNKGHRCYKDVYGVFIGDFDSEYNYEKLLVNFNQEEIASIYNNVVNQIVNHINPDTLQSRLSLHDDYCFWVTGYSLSGSIASEVADRLNSEGEVYCYTFGATNPNTNGAGTNENIKNLINQDDLFPKIYNLDDSMFRSGVIYTDSIYDNLTYDYKYLTGSNYNEISPQRTNTIKYYLNEVRDSVTSNIDRIVKNISKLLYNGDYIFDISFTGNPLKTLENSLNKSRTEIKDAHSIKSYYVLSKLFDGFSREVEEPDWNRIEDEMEDFIEITEESRAQEEVLEAIKHMGEWYVANVTTYQAGSSKTPNVGARGLYKCDILENFATNSTISTDEYKTYDNANSIIYDFNKYPLYVGDDCTDFAMAVILDESNGVMSDKVEYRGNIKESQNNDVNAEVKKDDNPGLKLHDTNAEQFISKPTFERAMNRLGYRKIYISEFNSIKDLHLGDLLCTYVTNGSHHVEFYVGYIKAHKNDAVDDDDYEWIKVSDITDEYQEYTQYVRNGIDYRDSRAYSTFGWGGRHTSFPSPMNYFVLGGTNNNRVINSNSTSGYTVVYRKD